MRLPHVCLDHFPIMLNCGGIHMGRRYFKFENMCLKVDDFVDKGRHWWSTCQFYSTCSLVLVGKLRF